MQKQFPFHVFTAAVLVALVLPTALQDGMFMDGLLYACVSKNLADGIGTFWFPHLSKTLHSFFDQQPPLGFGIQAVFFEIFGGSIYVERGYSFLMALLNAGLIALLWRTVFKNESEIKKMTWLPVLFWITIPVCFWAYSNNILENTMSIFDLLAIILLVRFFQTKSLFLIGMGGVFIFLASLTKGIQGLFPLASIFFGWVAYRSFSFWKMLSYSVLLAFVPFTIYFLLLQNESAYQSLSTYLHHRVLNSIQHAEQNDGRFYLIFRLFNELLPVILAATIFFVLERRQNVQANTALRLKRHVLFFILIGISASAPLIVTFEQRGFYLVTSFPYFAIAFSVVSASWLSVAMEKINLTSRVFKILLRCSFLLLVGALVFSFLQLGKVSRDKDALHDIHLIGKEIPRGEIVGATSALWNQWSFGEYLIRHYYISIDNRIKKGNDYVILESGETAPDSIKIEKVNIPTLRYHLYKAQR